jgi:glycine/D-amino acid oxidase-like deaminating enzyme
MSATTGFDADHAEHHYTEELQRRADAIRAELDRTLHALDKRSGLPAAIKNNPVPVLMTAVGFIAAAAALSRSRRRPGFDPWVSRPAGELDPTQSLATGAQETSNRMRRAASQLRQGATRTYETTRARTSEAGRRLSVFTKEQPLACSVVALALGFLTSTLLPMTSLERRLASQLREAGRRAADGLSQSAEADEPDEPEAASAGVATQRRH